MMVSKLFFLVFPKIIPKNLIKIRRLVKNKPYKMGGGGGVRPFTLEKNDFDLGVRGDGQDTSRNFKGSFRSIRATLPM